MMHWYDVLPVLEPLLTTATGGEPEDGASASGVDSDIVRRYHRSGRDLDSDSAWDSFIPASVRASVIEVRHTGRY